MTSSLLSEDKILLGCSCATKWDAIAAAGELLVRAGHVEAEYPRLMVARELVGTTYVGNGVAIPHGTREAMPRVRSPGISVLQIPNGVDFGAGGRARLVLGLAARDGAHLDLLTHIATVCADDTQLDRLLRATSAAEIVAALSPALGEVGLTPAAALISRPVVVRNPHGLHARPAHRFVEAARAHPLGVRLRKGDRVADAKSVLAVLTLGVKGGDSVTVELDGGDLEMLRRIEQIIRQVVPEDLQPSRDPARARFGAGT